MFFHLMSHMIKHLSLTISWTASDILKSHESQILNKRDRALREVNSLADIESIFCVIARVSTKGRTEGT